MVLVTDSENDDEQQSPLVDEATTAEFLASSLPLLWSTTVFHHTLYEGRTDTLVVQVNVAKGLAQTRTLHLTLGLAIDGHRNAGRGAVKAKGRALGRRALDAVENERFEQIHFVRFLVTGRDGIGNGGRNLFGADFEGHLQEKGGGRFVVVGHDALPQDTQGLVLGLAGNGGEFGL